MLFLLAEDALGGRSGRLRTYGKVRNSKPKAPSNISTCSACIDLRLTFDKCRGTNIQMTETTRLTVLISRSCVLNFCYGLRFLGARQILGKVVEIGVDCCYDLNRVTDLIFFECFTLTNGLLVAN
jgi:hypothetical protein